MEYFLYPLFMEYSCPPLLPAAVFIDAAKAVSRVEKEMGDIVQALLFPLPAFWFMM